MKKLLFASTMLAACNRRELSSCRGGYAVVDPMPVPAGCVGIAGRSMVTAKWKSPPADGGVATDGGAAGGVIVVELSVPGDANADFDGAVKYGGGELKPVRREGLTVVYEIALREESTVWASFEVPVHCPPDASPMGGNGRLSVQLSLDKPGGKITASLMDQ